MSDNIILGMSGLGMFLFGMIYMENALKDAAGRSFKDVLKKSTDTIIKAIIVGILATMLFQSSSIVSLMTLSFVGAGLMNLRSGIGIIFGANIGTTATAWIVALFGFKINIEAIAIPMIGFASIALIVFSSKRTLSSISKIFIGFGIMFLGLGYMKESTEIFAKTFDLSHYLNYHEMAYIGMGFVLTAVIQASAAVNAIILSALNSGIIDFRVGTSMVIGANIGTTSTAILGAIGGTADKKRIALAHLLFNVITGVIAFLLLPLLTMLITEKLGFENDLTTGLALFHTIFNVLGVLILAPFIPMFADYLNRLFVKREDSIIKYIDKVDTKVSDASITALKNETIHFLKKSMEFILFNLNIRPVEVLVEKAPTKSILFNNRDVLELSFDKMYEDLKAYEMKIIAFANDITKTQLTQSEVTELDKLLRSLREISFANKGIKDIKSNIDEVSGCGSAFEADVYERFRKRFVKLFKNFAKIMDGDLSETPKLVKIYKSIEADNKSSLNTISNAIKAYSIRDTLASSVMNADRVVYNSSVSLLEALKLIFVVELKDENGEILESSAKSEVELIKS